MTNLKSCDSIDATRKEERDFTEILTAVLLMAAAVGDVQNCRVSNHIIAAGLLLGIFTNLRQNGYMGIFSFFLGMMVPILLFWLLFRFRMLGAGDIKLFSVVGGLYGASFVLRVIVAAFFLGAVMSVFQLLRYKNLKFRLQYLAEYVSVYVKTGEAGSYYQKERDGAEPVVHFAVAVFGGFLLCILRKGGSI